MRRWPLLCALAFVACDAEPTVRPTSPPVLPPTKEAPVRTRPNASPDAALPPGDTLPPLVQEPITARCKNLDDPKKKQVAAKLDAGPFRVPEAHDSRIRGVDVGSKAPWRDIRQAGFRFAYVQAAYGIAKNEDFESNWRMAKECGVLRGAYHFVTPKRDPKAQARVFAELLRDDPGELPPSVDIERPVECKKDECCELTCAEWIALVDVWVAHVDRALGRKALVYTIEPHWNQCLCGTERFDDRALWLAGWPKFDFPANLRFGGWKKWTFYQHAGNVRLSGTVVDLNLFRGTESDLGALAAPQ